MHDALDIEEIAAGVRFRIRVSPRASRDQVGGVHDGALKVKTTAPPVDGAANAKIVALLAKALGVARSRVRIVGGQSSKSKRVEVEGIDEDTVRRLG